MAQCQINLLVSHMGIEGVVGVIPCVFASFHIYFLIFIGNPICFIFSNNGAV